MTGEARTVAIHGHEIAYRCAGTGPALLLLHGIAGSADTWTHVMGPLSKRFTVIAPDLLGHGDSAKPDGDYSLGAYASGMRDLLHVLGIESATIVGQSFGGGVAMQLAYQHPEFCERLVLVDSGGLGREVSPLLRFFTLPGAEYLMPVLFPGFVRDPGDSVVRWLSSFGFGSARITELWSGYRALTYAENRKPFARIIRGVIEPGGQSVSAMDRMYLAAHVPTLIIWGDDDGIIPVEHAYAAHEAIPGSRLEIIPGGGHSPQVEEPARFVEILVDFVDTTEAVAAGSAYLRDQLQRRAASL